jgi:alcohol dehydrogenase class IV
MTDPALGTATVTNNTQTRFGFGALGGLGDVLAKAAVARPLLCTDRGLIETGLVDTVSAAIPEDRSVTLYDGTPPNPTEAAVDEAAALYREGGCDGIIGVGGGSPLDLAKAVAVRVSHDGDLVDYTAGRGGVGRIGPVMPLIAIPTTAGTGSEVSRAAIIIVASGEKLIVASPHLVPAVSICDPELTMGLPPGLTAATGMDAVTHCIEAVMSPVVNPPAEAIGIDGLERALGAGHLEGAVADGGDREARWNMMMASTEGAMAFSKGLGCVHSMSHACGADQELRLHHGTLNAVTLPAVLRFCHGHIGDKDERLRRAMNLPVGADLADAIQDLNRRLGLPPGLEAMGVTDAMVPGLIQHAVADMCTRTSPRPADAAAFAGLFADAM